MKFSKKKMTERLNKAGIQGWDTEDVIKIMDNLDGCDATASNWRGVVHDEPLLWVVGKDGTGQYVYEGDCE